MKNLIKIIILLLIVSSCTETENVMYDESGQYGVGFSSPTVQSVIVPEEGITKTLTIQTSSKSSSDRSYDVIIDDTSVGDAANYNIGTLTIPANSYEGQVDVIFTNFDNLVENTPYKLVLNLDLPDSVGKFTSQTVTLNYLKKVICNDLDLTINTDYWSDETTWELKDSDGTVLQSGGPYPKINGGATYNLQFHLNDGTYTFFMYDSYGDGMVTNAQTGIDAVVGSYSLDCGLINHVHGGGAFGSVDETEFYINL